MSLTAPRPPNLPRAAPTLEPAAGSAWGAAWSAAAVTVPHAVGLGLLAFAPLAATHSVGALALWSAALPGLLLTLVQPRPGVVHAPTTVVALLFGSVLATVQASAPELGLAPRQVLAVTGATVALAFLFQWLFGVLRLASAAGFLPVSVMHGFAAGVGLSMVLGQARSAFGSGGWDDARWPWHALAALAVVLLAWGLRWRWPRVPGLLPAVVLVGVAVGVAGVWDAGLDAVFVAAAPASGFAGPLWPDWGGIDWLALVRRDGQTLVVLALLMALVNSLEVLIFQQELALEHGLHADANAVLRRESLLCALCAMAGMIPASTSASRSRIVLADAGPRPEGPRRHALIMLGVALTGAWWLHWVPMAALAGALILAGVLQVPPLMWSRRYARQSRLTWGQSWLVALVFAFFSGAVALVAGLVVATFVLLRESAATVLRHVRLDGELRSRRLRRGVNEGWIAPRMNQVAVFEFQGVMWFGVAAHLSEQVRLLLQPRHCWVVLNAARVPAWDSTALAQLRGLARDLRARGAEVAVASLDAQARVDVGADVRQFADLDRALEWCESSLLAQRPAQERAAEHGGDDDPLGEVGEGLHAHARAALLALLRLSEVTAGQVVFAAGDSDRDLLIVQSGYVTLLTDWPASDGMRLATVGPGMAFGEMGFLSGAPRSACAGVEQGHARLARLARADFDDWTRAYPDQALTVLLNLAQIGTRRLAATTRQLRAVLE